LIINSQAARHQSLDHRENVTRGHAVDPQLADHGRDANRGRDSSRGASASPDDMPTHDGHDGDLSDDSTPPSGATPGVKQERKSSQLQFYKGHWVETLIFARNWYRFHIHSAADGQPFPEHNTLNLQVIHDHILEAVEHVEEKHGLLLDHGAYFFLVTFCILIM
jgi:hypothetical protein